MSTQSTKSSGFISALKRTADRLEAVLRAQSQREPSDYVERKIATHPDLCAARAEIAKAKGTP